MQEIDRIRFVTTNFSNLQGLRNLPIGACLLVITICASQNQSTDNGWSFLVSILTILICAALYYFIDRFYLAAYGRVKRTSQSRQLEWLVSILMGCFALIAFWVDVSLTWQISLFGLVFAAGLLIDNFRFTWFVKGARLIFYPIGAVFIAIISCLSVFGLSGWWLYFGFSDQLFAVVVFIALYVVFASIIGHLHLTRLLKSNWNDNDDNAI